MTKAIRGQKNQGRKGILRVIKAYFDRRRLGELLVMKGMITPHELRFALGKQKKTNTPIGQILVKHDIISKRQLSLVLGSQTALRLAAACLFFAATTTYAKKARADAIKDVPAMISISASDHFARVAAYPALYNTDEKLSRNLKPFTKWTSMFERFERELRSSSNSRLLNNWKKDLAGYKGLPLRAMADKVNTLVNKTEYILDNKNWGKSDYWATPVEFLKRGGDCEDFAIAKYTALRILGVPEERMRVAIVHDNLKNIPHAVLVVYTEGGAYILDNQTEKLVRAESKGRYRPIFSINRTAWWLHTAPTTTIIASAE